MDYTYFSQPGGQFKGIAPLMNPYQNTPNHRPNPNISIVCASCFFHSRFMSMRPYEHAIPHSAIHGRHLKVQAGSSVPPSPHSSPPPSSDMKLLYFFLFVNLAFCLVPAFDRTKSHWKLQKERNAKAVRDLRGQEQNTASLTNAERFKRYATRRFCFHIY